MQERSIIGVLCHMRSEIIREKLEGLDHVEALMRLRGFDPASQHVRHKQRQNRFRQSQIKRAVIAALKDGPLTGRDMAARIHTQRPDLTYKEVYDRQYQALARMKQGCGLQDLAVAQTAARLAEEQGLATVVDL